MNMEPGNDLISQLPEEIIDNILSKLPIVDAIKTSLLSTSWRYRWRFLSDIVFDDRSLVGKTPEEVVDFITSTLLLHNGFVHKFVLSSSTERQDISRYIDRWLLVVSQKDVKELVVDFQVGPFLKMPSCIFSCNNLSRLELCACEFYVPLNFNGFQSLKYLSLEEVKLDHYKHDIERQNIEKQNIEKLISSCPVLEILKLWSWFEASILDLTVHSQSLRCLDFRGDIMGMCFACPNLVDVSASLYMFGDSFYESLEQSWKCSFETFFGSIPKLERLVGCRYFIKFFSIGSKDLSCFSNLISCQPLNKHLKTIELGGVDFKDVDQVLTVTRLLRNSPSLTSLKISSFIQFDSDAVATQASSVEFLDGDISPLWSLHQLKTVKLNNVYGLPYELKFIKLIHRHSPNLEVMRISPWFAKFSKDERLSFYIDLLSLGSCSKASIVFDNEQA